MPAAIIFDTEFTSWEGAMARNWSGLNEYRELVQIGAVRIDTQTFAVLDTLELLVKPVRNPILSDYFIDLTSITQAEVEAKGIDFASALTRFMDFTGKLLPWSYGGDVAILTENMQLNSLPAPPDFPSVAATNLMPWFHHHAPETIGSNSGRLAERVGVKLAITEHTGLGDSLSITAAMKELVLNRGKPSPFFPSDLPA